MGNDLKAAIAVLCEQISAIVDIDARIEAINAARQELHKISPFSDHPVDLVQWVRLASVEANDYNPNKVAPPEMRLLEHSIVSDGYTQPIVTCDGDGGVKVVVDGFHRNRVGREVASVRDRLHGYLPVTTVRADRTDRGDLIAATIRHNRARGRHMVVAMTEIVLELAKRNWNDKKIAKELGMDQDEVLRLKQIGGLAELFADQEFSEAWDVTDGEL